MDFIQQKVNERLERERKAEEVALFGFGVLEAIYAHLLDSKAITGNEDTDLAELEVAMAVFLEVYDKMGTKEKKLIIESARGKRRWQEIAGTEDPELYVDEELSERPSAGPDWDEQIKDKFSGAILIDSNGHKMRVRNVELEYKSIPDPERWTKTG